jgi:NRAMP (natural resistance-associated macrophage protein)-like metal ion transporter
MAARRRHHETRRRLRGFGYFARIGPAIVTGAADDDPSGIGTYSQVGAVFGYGLLWLAPFTLPLAAAVQEAAGRLGITTGHGLASSIGRRFPRPVLWFAVALVCIANVFNIGADLASMAAAVRLLMPVPFSFVLVGMALALIGLEVGISYRRYSKVLRWLTLSLFTYVAVLFVVGVDWGEVIRSTLIPSLSWSRPELAAVIAILGTTISPYLFFWQASEEVEEEELTGTLVDAGGTPVEPVDDTHVAAMRGDVAAGMVSAVGVMFAIMVAAATALHGPNGGQIATAAQAASALEPAAGRFASLLFTLGIVGTGALAIPVLAGSTGYALSEVFGWSEGLSKTLREARGFYLVVGVAVLAGLAMDFAGLDPIRTLFMAAVLNGLVAPPLIVLMLVLANDQSTVGRWRSGALSNVLVGLALLAMVAAPVAYLLV